ncbi:RNA-guided endonuclease InsQ/TnpB family protein [Argonema antarcticum]|uniref:RNA-guided endonuclease InsQ/TnpB family protein n=1 Tax=Argonema antarcticum TaxID=2942763 RepID=UPI0023DF8306|nr:transposase [Argonema antarcticum]MCL1474753.1 transposase [Argonema antarcticum A004/B2]
MLLTYQYKIKPSPEQKIVMMQWLELLRRHYNYSLGQRLDWLSRTRCSIDRCSLVSEPIGDIPEQFPNYNFQAGLLKQTKELFPEYKYIYHDVQQQNLKRLDKAWDRWIKPDKSGKRGGRPRFKKVGELRSFTFPRVNCAKAGAHINNGILKLSKIGKIPVIVHRSLPHGFVLKTCTIVKKADGWYVCISAEDETVPTPKPIDTVKTAVGIDVGLKEFLTTSDGEVVPIQQIYRKAQNHLARQQRFLVRQEKGSNSYKKQQNKIAKIHQRIQRQRKDFHYKTAHQLVRAYDLIAVEDLQIKNLARNSKLAKSILDAAWSQFITILESVAVKCGVHIVKVNPHNTSQDCSGCGIKVPKTLSVRTHCCPKCNLTMDRDENAAINILIKALQAVGLIVSAGGGLVGRQPVKPEA